jgi:hypothetical protein
MSRQPGAPAAPQSHRQGPVALWVSQMIATLVLAAVVLYFMRSIGASFGEGDPDWRRYAAYGIIVGIAPALLYLGYFKVALDADEAAIRKNGVPDPLIRPRLLRSLAIGSALCEIPMAMGVVQLFLGGESRWFLGATFVTIALRLSYRPFTKA